MKLPTLYHKAKGGELRQWSTWAEGADVITEYGHVGGKLQISRKTSIGKNIGKKNETTPEEQAILESKALWQHKVERKYAETPEDAQEQLPLPMLAHKFSGSKKKKFVYPGHVQAKLDGCVFRTTILQTDEGPRYIEDIVESQLSVSVLSFNTESNALEYKPVVNWFKNGESHYSDWLDIKPKDRKYIKCTKNHKIYVKKNDVVDWSRADEIVDGDEILLEDHSDYLNSLIAGTLLGDSFCVVEKRNSGKSYRLAFTHTNKEYFDFKVQVLNLEGSIQEIETGYGSKGWRFTSRSLNQSNFPIKKWYFTGNHSRCGQRKTVSASHLKNILTPESLSLWISDDGSLAFNNGNSCTPRLTLSTHNHSQEQINEFVKYFESKWGCIPSQYTDKRVNSNGVFLTFNSKDTLYILNVLARNNCHCKGMEHKFYFQALGFLRTATKESRWVPCNVSHSRKMPLATKYDIEVEDNHNYIANGVLVHNCRALAQRGPDGKIILTSRQGKPWNIPLVEQQLDHWLPDNVILDGELYAHGHSCQKATSWARSADPNGRSYKQESRALIYHVYDAPSVEGDDTLPWKDRYEYVYNELEPGGYVQLVQAELANSQDDVFAAYSSFMSQGYEGAVLRGMEGRYLWGYRSSELLKIKEFQDAEFTVIGAKEGIGKMKGCVVWICQNDTDNSTFECVTKNSMDERRNMFARREEFIGKYLTVRFFDRTDAGIPRFPVGIVFRDDIDLPN